MNLKLSPLLVFDAFSSEIDPKQGGGKRLATLFWEPPKAAAKFDEKSPTEGSFLIRFDSFLMFSFLVTLAHPGPDGFMDLQKFKHLSF